jgi:hypothetical protein
MSRANIGCNRGYGCEWIFAISDPNPIRCHHYSPRVGVATAIHHLRLCSAVPPKFLHLNPTHVSRQRSLPPLYLHALQRFPLYLSLYPTIIIKYHFSYLFIIYSYFLPTKKHSSAHKTTTNSARGSRWLPQICGERRLPPCTVPGRGPFSACRCSSRVTLNCYRGRRGEVGGNR